MTRRTDSPEWYQQPISHQFPPCLIPARDQPNNANTLSIDDRPISTFNPQCSIFSIIIRVKDHPTRHTRKKKVENEKKKKKERTEETKEENQKNWRNASHELTPETKKPEENKTLANRGRRQALSLLSKTNPACRLSKLFFFEKSDEEKKGRY